MGTLGRIRAALATAAGRATDGRAYAYAPDTINVGPRGAAVVVPDPGDAVLVQTTLRGSYRSELRVRLVVLASSDSAGQALLDELISPDGAGSAVAAIEGDATLGALADRVWVREATSYGEYAEGDGGARHYQAELLVTVEWRVA